MTPPDMNRSLSRDLMLAISLRLLTFLICALVGANPFCQMLLGCIRLRTARMLIFVLSHRYLSFDASPVRLFPKPTLDARSS